MNPIYLDNNATTPLDSRVQRSMVEAYQAHFANPASPHREGQRASRRLNQLRDSILSHLRAETKGTEADRLIFTSGGTESNNLALFGLARAARRNNPAKTRVITSSIEHPSVSETATQLSLWGFQVMRIDCDSNGVVSLEHLAELLDETTALVSIMSVNNETGVIQPVAEAGKLCSDLDVVFHSDAVQAVGKTPVDFSGNHLSALSLTSHKLHGPRGIGALILNGQTELEPIMFGGFQQLGTRPGTEDVALASGLATAIDLAFEEFDTRNQSVREMRDKFEKVMLDQFRDSIRIFGYEVPRAPHTSNIAFIGGDRQAIVMAADMAGICCSTGSACASGSSEPSPVLIAMGCNDDEIRSAVRFSFSWMLTPADIDLAAMRIAQVVIRLRG